MLQLSRCRIRRAYAQGLTLLTASLLISTGGCTTGAKKGESVAPDSSQAVAEDGSDKPQNPGGMWLPGQIPALSQSVKDMGYEGDILALSDPTKFPLNAVVSLGGCSGSFVSPEGLLVTNHHCSVGYLQHNSTPEQNLMQTGYLARTRPEEKSAGPRARVYITTEQQDVSSQVQTAAAGASDEVARKKAREDFITSLEKSCTDPVAGKRCYVASFYEGAQHILIKQDVIRDLRLVYAPHDGIGVFGGEIDNWRWPRHTGDFTFLRAYVGPDGKPADYSPQNVPYRPKSFLRVAAGDLNEGDFALVAGYPGRTSRLRTAGEVDTAMRWYFPTRIRAIEKRIAVLNQVAASDPALAIKVAGMQRGLSNALTNSRGMLDGLSKDGLARQKAQEEAQIRAFIAADPQRYEKYHGLFDKIAAINTERDKTREQYYADRNFNYSSTYLRVANLLLKAGKERDENGGKLDEAKQKSYEQSLAALFKNADPRIDKAMIKLSLEEAAAMPEDQRPAFYAEIAKKAKDSAEIQKAVDKFLDKSKFTDLEYAKKQLAKASEKKLRKSKDPLMKLAVVRKDFKESDAGKAQEKLDARMASLRPEFVQVLREYRGNKPLAPDANGTLRITYGTIRGYKPAADKPVYRPFTTLPEMVAKHTGQPPFVAPPAILAAAQRGEFGSYADAELKTLPVNFLADLDITGGNSGSATLNAKGELIGLVFDGNYEAMASDWVFMPSITRSIHVDMRYVLWVMDAVDHADHLLLEMGITPQISAPVAAR